MQIVGNYDPTLGNTAVVGSSSTFTFVVPNGGKVLFINESYWNQKVQFQNGQNFYLPANDRRFISLTGQMAQPGATITWTNLSSLAVPNNVTNIVVVETYEPGEPSPEIYPSPLLRQLNAAGAIGQLQVGPGTNCTTYMLGGIDGPTSSNIGVFATLGGELFLGDLVHQTGKLNLDMTQSPVVVNGSSGNIVRYAPIGDLSCRPGTVESIIDSFKLYVFKAEGYVNASFADITFPQQFTQWLLYFNTIGGAISFVIAGTPQNVNVVSSFFGTTSTSTVNNNSWGYTTVGTPITTLRIGNTGGGTYNNAVVVIGV